MGMLEHFGIVAPGTSGSISAYSTTIPVDFRHARTWASEKVVDVMNVARQHCHRFTL
jgi:hypothetical protein